MRKFSLFTLFSILSLLFVASVFGQQPYLNGGPTPPLSGIPPQLNMPAPGQAQAFFGHHIGIADFDGDTKGEVAVGAPFVNVGGNLSQGRVFVYAGSGGCLYVNGAFTGTLNQPDPQAGAQFGFTVATFDIDNDGIPDLIVSAPSYNAGGAEDQGKVYVFFGPDFQQWNFLDKPGAPAQHALFGFSLAAGRFVPAGPSTQRVILVGAPEEDDGPAVRAGKAYFFIPTGLRGATGDPLPLSNIFALTLSTGSQAGARYGYAVALGDINGGGLTDPIIGAPFWNNVLAPETVDEGVVEYWLGAATPVRVNKPGLRATNAFFGFSLAAADVNNNGHVDIIAGAPGDVELEPQAGQGHVYRIDIDGFTEYASPNPTHDGRFGFTVAVGDIDRDGIPDIIASATGETVGINTSSGKVYAFTSTSPYNVTGLPLFAAFFLGPPAYIQYNNSQKDALFGYAIAVGEIQTIPLDLAIGAIGIEVANPGPPPTVNLSQGRVYLFIEDSPPNPPTIVSPAPGAVLATKSVVLQAGPFTDRNIATCSPGPTWTDFFDHSVFRISSTSEADCKAGNNIVFAQIINPGQTQTTVIDLFNGTTPVGVFNFGSTVYWCVEYFDDYDVGSGWTSSSFKIGIPDLAIGSIREIPIPNPGYAPIIFTNVPELSPPAPPLFFNPRESTVDFRTVSCDDCRKVEITVQNDGTATAHVTAATIQDLVGTGTFTINSVTPPVPFDVAPDGIFLLTVTACGSVSVGSTTAEIETLYNDPFEYDINLSIASAAPTGIVTNVGPPPFPPPVFNNLIDLGDVPIGSPPVVTPIFVCETSGNAGLKVSSVTIAGDPAYDWQWADDAKILPGIVAPGTCRIIHVIFTPSSQFGCGDDKNATLTVVHNGSDGTNGACQPVTATQDFTADVVGADLIGSWVRFTSTKLPNTKRSVSGTLRIQNVGAFPVTADFKVSFYLSRRRQLNTSATLLFTTPPIIYNFAPNAVKNIGFSQLLDASAGGQFIIAVVDSENVVPECSDFIPPVPPPAGLIPWPLEGFSNNNVAIPATGLYRWNPLTTVPVANAVGIVNDAPVAVNDAYSTDEDTILTVTAPGVLANDTDPNGAPLTAVLVGNVSHGVLVLNANGSFVYTPNANFFGTDSFTYQASDGFLFSNTATVTITVVAVNDAPVAVNDAYSTTLNTAKNVAAPGVLTNDTDAEGSSLTAVLVIGPSHGTLGLNADGSFTYTPTTGFIGIDSFTYRASDGSLLSNVATVTITVTP